MTKMVFDYSAGGTIPITHSSVGFIANGGKKHDEAIPSASIDNNAVTALHPFHRLEYDGPIGQAIRDKRFDQLRTAISKVKESRLK